MAEWREDRIGHANRYRIVVLGAHPSRSFHEQRRTANSPYTALPQCVLARVGRGLKAIGFAFFLGHAGVDLLSRSRKCRCTGHSRISCRPNGWPIT